MALRIAPQACHSPITPTLGRFAACLGAKPLSLALAPSEARAWIQFNGMLWASALRVRVLGESMELNCLYMPRISFGALMPATYQPRLDPGALPAAISVAPFGALHHLAPTWHSALSSFPSDACNVMRDTSCGAFPSCIKTANKGFRPRYVLRPWLRN